MHSPLGKSDHSVVSFKFHCYLDFTEAKESYAYAKDAYVSMRNELENSKWLWTYTALNGQTTIDDKWLSLKSKLTELKETFVAKQSISGKPSWKDKGCFPINKHTQKAIKHKNRTYRARIRSTVLNASESSRLEYTKARNKVRTNGTSSQTRIRKRYRSAS